MKAVQLALDDLMQLPATESKAVPFVKWAGGKRKLIGAIMKVAPIRFERYLEPFLGGGALALALNHPAMLLNDANSELINSYRVIKDNLEALVELLENHRKNHSEAYYYQVREQKTDSLSSTEKAARFIYLNKTCFNGLYRVNKYGQFNVPFGRYDNPVLYERENLQAVAGVLANAELFSMDYSSFLLTYARAGDFIYLDPPYVPISKYSDFKRYTKEQFREEDQYRLAQLFKELVGIGAYPVLSNSYSPLTQELYAEFDIHVVMANRNINQDGNGRRPIKEVLVSAGRSL